MDECPAYFYNVPAFEADSEFQWQRTQGLTPSAQAGVQTGPVSGGRNGGRIWTYNIFFLRRQWTYCCTYCQSNAFILLPIFSGMHCLDFGLVMFNYIKNRIF